MSRDVWDWPTKCELYWYIRIVTLMSRDVWDWPTKYELYRYVRIVTLMSRDVWDWPTKCEFGDTVVLCLVLISEK
jgi:hypothetical protein